MVAFVPARPGRRAWLVLRVVIAQEAGDTLHVCTVLRLVIDLHVVNLLNFGWVIHGRGGDDAWIVHQMLGAELWLERLRSSAETGLVVFLATNVIHSYIRQLTGVLFLAV